MRLLKSCLRHLSTLNSFADHIEEQCRKSGVVVMTEEDCGLHKLNFRQLVCLYVRDWRMKFKDLGFY